MKFTLGWLKEHLDTDASLQDITEKLTDLGLEIESVEDRSATYAPFKVAYVEKAEKHPDADRLKVCVVDTGSEKLQVVCGAPNCRTGMKAVFAPAGSVIPGSGDVLKKGVIRGQESNGMLVSMDEMALEDDSEGIIEIGADVKLGTPLADIFGLNDPMIDISITPNRADATGIRGIARDLAAAGMGKLKPLDSKAIKGAFKSPVGVSIESQKECPLFLGRYIKGVKNGPSPDWMQKRLKSVGLRPISALVDITNYLSLDVCRPLHVFDADKLKGHINVRLAKKGEKLEALNDKTYELDNFMTAVCDDSGVLGLGGVMGGVPSSCTETTTNVYVECAYFDPYAVARTGRALEIISDARYRFERGIDPQFTMEGMEIATRLIMEICGGEASEVVQAGDVPEWKRTIDFDPAYTKKLGGIDVPEKRQVEILASLGFEVNKNKVQPPSWRGDIEGRADLVEEVLRVNGFDKIEAVSVRSTDTVSASAETKLLSRGRKARVALAARGLSECVTWSFMPKALAGEFGSADSAMTLTNPISTDMIQMRPSILPNLLQAASGNANKGYADTALFEVGPVFESVKVDGQKLVAAGVRFGALGPRHWSGAEASRKADALDAKADAIAALEAAGAPSGNLQIGRDAPSYYHPGRSGTLKLGPNVLARFGEIHPAVMDEMGLKTTASAFEVFLDNIPEPKKKGTAKPLLTLSPFQPVQRDFAFIVSEASDAEAIMKAARSADKMIERVDVFDIYQGKGVEAGKKSVAINVVIQPVAQTLTDPEIESICKNIVGAVAAKCGGVLRT